MNRYPGARPFSTRQEMLFHGRSLEVEDLIRELQLNRLTVLHGRSGLGKSSLICAGLIPRLRQAAVQPFLIRLGVRKVGTDASPLGKLLLTLPDPGAPAPALAALMPPQEESLWYRVLRWREAGGSGPLVLLFDQLEELFTYPPHEVQAFAAELAEALQGRPPERVERMLQLHRGSGSAVDPDLEARIYQPLQVRVLFSIRSDRLHLLDRLAAKLPDIQRNRYRLQPLSAAGARQAIELPAALDGPFDTPPFTYREGALRQIIDFLQDGEGRVEGIQLQILCQSFEEQVRRAGGRLRELGTKDLGDLDALIGNYYQDRIAGLGDAAEQRAARRLIEEGLVVESERQRAQLGEGQIREQYGINGRLLQKLVDSHLLRMEPSRLGAGYTYELSHDTLIEPVLEAKGKRQERLRQRRLLLVAGASLLLFTATLLAGIWVRQQLLRTQEALAAVAELLARDTEEHIYFLDYAAAEQNLRLIQETGQLADFVAEKFFEFAFLEVESGNLPRARTYLAELPALGFPPPPDWQESPNRQALRRALQDGYPEWQARYSRRYYPEMVAVDGGRFLMGAISPEDRRPAHPVRLDRYRIARTETTVWQYHLYARATGKGMPDRPSWGWEGDNPVVSISWQDAVDYAEWLTRQRGGEPGYRLPTEAEWEFAARGGPRGVVDHFLFAGSDDLDRVGWYRENSGNRARPVAAKAPNQLGLYDMSGNTQEWVQDWYGPYPEAEVVNPRGPDSGTRRVLRGGSWKYDDRLDCRVFNRVGQEPKWDYNNHGFRLARDD